ncbi:hypothetical protein VNI00_011590 [Paramarasmius palmivorus]|uniref:Uncharacterized protein n=1 Tax=Paramarasmius palmivorus TaxID=297713 RepID=A0AAW0CAC5_9AGAR
MYFLILPVTSEPGLIVPGDWALVRVTKANGDILQRTYNIYKALDQRAREIFNNDVLRDASESVIQNLVNERDLAEFKARLYERRNLLAKLMTTHLDTSILQDDASLSEEVSISSNGITSIRDTASSDEVDPSLPGCFPSDRNLF